METYFYILLLVCLKHCYGDQSVVSVSGRAPVKYPYYYGSYYLYYLTFIAIKIKVAIIIGLAVYSMFFFGKLFTFIAFLYRRDQKCPEAKEKIIIEKVPYHVDHHDNHDHHNGPEKKISLHNPYHKRYSHKHGGRSISNKIIGGVNFVKSIIKRIDLTDVAFKQMNVNKRDCRKRFLCEIDEKAKRNALFGVLVYMFSETGLEKYSPNKKVSSLQECKKIYKGCSELFE